MKYVTAKQAIPCVVILGQTNMFNTIITTLAKQSSRQVSLVYCTAGAGC